MAVTLAGSHFVCADEKATEGKKDKKKRPPPIVSPIFAKDGAVTFLMKAANAQNVQLSGEMVAKNIPFTKGDDGIWSVTLRDIDPGIYGYSFVVDGMKMLDGGNPSAKPMRSPRTSILHVPGDHVFDRKDVPHGTIHHHGYQCKPINRFREIKVYTPPGYEKSQDAYPLLVLQHGHSDSFETWTKYGKAHWILDNLIAQGKAKPMIVVMLDGHPVPESYGGGRSIENTDELETDLIESAMPLVEELYRVKAGSQNRAIAGLSMGGLHSLTIGLRHTDQFGWIGAFSAAVPEPDDAAKLLADGTSVNDNLKLLWIACGKKDFLLKENQRFIGELETAGIKHRWLLTAGGHAWPVWRQYLAEFAPLLFQ